MLTDIIKTVFTRLNREKLPATPDLYRKIFCEEARKLGLYSAECNSINSLEDALSYKNRVKLKELKIESMDELLEYLSRQLEETSTGNYENGDTNKTDLADLIGIVDIVKDALQPSLGNLFHEEINDFNLKISADPTLITLKSTQDEFHHLVEERFNTDKKAIISKTSDLAKILSNITKSLHDSINTNKDGSAQVNNLKKDLENLDISNYEDKLQIKELKEQFLSIATAIEDEAILLSTSLSKENNKISALEKKIQDLEKQLTDTKKRANSDFLTGALTRQAFDDLLKKLEKEYLDNESDYSAVFFDLDHFKKINDTYGHDAGDHILSTFAKLLRKEFKDKGKVARYGGEEFVVLLPQKGINESFIYTKKVQTILHRSQFVYDKHKLKITFSGGICQRSDKSSPQELIKHADALLYKAKNSGRDRIEF